MGTVLMDQMLNRLYYDPKSPVAFGGVQKLYKKLRSMKKISNVKLGQVKDWLNSQSTYTQHKPIRKRFPRRKTIVAGVDQQWQADLADLQHLMKHNNTNRYLLCVIDVFSRYAWAVPIKNKTGTTLIKAFETIFKSSKRKPLSLQIDKGTEFKTKTFSLSSSARKFISLPQKILRQKQVSWNDSNKP